MRIVIDIETTETFNLTQAQAYQLVHELIAQVARADKACREEYGPRYAGKTHGNWLYSRDDSPLMHALTYSMEITQ